jgi:methylphosphotriester-DNA--protein-cysteine methyltransferase
MATDRPRLRYTERATEPTLADHVFSYWELTVEQPEPFVHRVFPDGCFGLIYKRNDQTGSSTLRLDGGRLCSQAVQVRGGDRYWGVRIAPAACTLWFGNDPAALRGSLPPPARLPGASALLRRLDNAADFSGAVTAFDAHLRACGSDAQPIDRTVARAVSLIDEHRGQLPLPQLAAALGLSVRQLQRRFRAATSLTLKQFARTRRLRALGVELVAAQARDGASAGSWSARAADFGFADQAHLARELVAMTGRSPVRLAAALAEIEHTELVR